MDILPHLEVIIGDPRPPPECPHGPALLFKRLVGDDERLFYACSACRDRKGCKFFAWANVELSDSKKKIWELRKQKVLPAIDHKKLYVKLMKLLQSPNNRVYCHDCNELLSSKDAKKHLEHDIVDELTDYQIMHPSELLKPLENPKKEAQYLFSKKSTEMVVSALKNLGCKHILCIGAPRVHEYILSECSSDMDSVLLDIDHRYHQFHGPLQFCWYNVFNNHYFNKSASTRVVDEFLQQDSGEGVAIVIDPPFGGRVEPLANTVQQIIEQHRSLNSGVDSEMKVLWTFPYFMEPHLLSSLPEYKMLDYKVDYDNHPLFTQAKKGRKYGSPVRIFTNASPKDFPLPEEEGYRFCKPCQRWVSAENKHCKKCSKCTSKDGQTYVHCSTCKRCVKPSWLHCKTCQRCCFKGHKCGSKPSNKCYHCGEPGHKKADCNASPKKRKIDTLESTDSSDAKKPKTDIPSEKMGLKKGKKQNRKSATNASPIKQIMNGSPKKEVKVKKEKLEEINCSPKKEVKVKEEKLGEINCSPKKEVKVKKGKLEKINCSPTKEMKVKKGKLLTSGKSYDSPKEQKMNGNPQKDMVLKERKSQKSGNADDSTKKLKSVSPKKAKKQELGTLKKENIKKRVK